MNWQDIRSVIEQIDADNTRTSVEVKIAMIPRGIDIKCTTSCGFFTRTVQRLIPYGEAEYAVHLPGMIHATANEVRATMLREMKRPVTVKEIVAGPSGTTINSTCREGGY